MKKLFFIVMLCVLISGPVYAATCIGGTIISGRDQNRSFCLSDKKMNWWSAHQWCQSNGRVLAHPDYLCNYDGYGWYMGVYGCGNLHLNKLWPSDMWTALSLGEGKGLLHMYNRILQSSPLTYLAAAVCE